MGKYSNVGYDVPDIYPETWDRIKPRYFCTDCPIGKFSNISGRYKCFNCTAGRFANETGRHNCSNAPRGYYVPISGATRPSSCLDLRIKGEKKQRYFNTETGQTGCQKCPCHGTKGAGPCDITTGFCDCIPFYVDNQGRDAEDPLQRPFINCKTKQNVPQSITFAYIFLVFAVLVFIPLVFTSGILAALSKVRVGKKKRALGTIPLFI